jgi:uncharacterized membrane protein
MLPLILLFAGCGVLFAGLAIPMIRRRVPPNGFYGLRVPATFADEWVWYEANARTGWDMLWLGSLLLVLALAPLFFNVSENTYAFVGIAVMLMGTVAMAIVGWRRANRLLRQRQSVSVQPV